LKQEEDDGGRKRAGSAEGTGRKLEGRVEREVREGRWKNESPLPNSPYTTALRNTLKPAERPTYEHVRLVD